MVMRRDGIHISTITCTPDQQRAARALLSVRGTNLTEKAQSAPARWARETRASGSCSGSLCRCHHRGRCSFSAVAWGNFGATLWRRSLKFAYVAAPYCVLVALVDTWTAARVGERAGRGAIIRYAAALG